MDKRKRMALLMVLAMATTGGVPQVLMAGQFTDTATHWAAKEIDQWSGLGVIQGYNERFRPTEYITRADFAVIMDKVMGYQAQGENTFKDLEDKYYTEAVLKAYQAGVMQGDGAAIRPNDPITREEAVVILARVFNIEPVKERTNFVDDQNIASWAAGYVQSMVTTGYIQGVGENQFAPKASMTRGEVVKLLDNLTAKLYQVPGTYSEDITGNVIVNAAGVTLEHMRINGDLIIAEGLGEGEINLDQVEVTGNVYIKGGGDHTVYFSSVNVGGAMIVNKVDGEIRLVMTGATKASAVVLQSGAMLVTKDLVGGGIETVLIPADIIAGQKVVLKGNFNKVQNEAKNVAVEVEGSIKELILNGPATITGEATIGKVTLAEGVAATLNGSSMTSTSTSTGGPSSGGNVGDDDDDDSGSGEVVQKDYTITFQGNGSVTTPAALTIEVGKYLELPMNPSKVGYVFMGWHADENLTTLFNNAEPVRANHTLYAKWRDRAEVTTGSALVLFEGMGGGFSTPREVTTGSQLQLSQLPKPTKVGYELDGWYVDQACSVAFSEQDVISVDTTLYAKWKSLNSCRVTFDTNGGSAIAPIEVEKGKFVTLPAAPTKEEAQFLGWYIDEALQVPFNSSTEITEHLTLYAKWTGWQEAIYTDARFANGYPKATIVDGRIQLQVQLKEAASPTKVYMVVNQINSHVEDVDVTSIVEGRVGIGSHLTNVDETPYIEVSDTNLHTVDTGVRVRGEDEINVYFVLEDEVTGLSTDPTLVAFALDAVKELDTIAPRNLSNYINEAKDKVYVYFGEKLKDVSSLSASDFQLSSGTVKSAAIVEGAGFTERFGCVALEVEGITSIADLNLTYSGTSLSDQATTPNKVEGFTSQVESAAIEVTESVASYDGQYIHIELEKADVMMGHDIVVKYGNSKESASVVQYEMSGSSIAYDGSWCGYHLKLESPVTRGGKFYITIGEQGLKTFSLDEVAPIQLELELGAVEEAQVQPQSVVYNRTNKELMVGFDESVGLEVTNTACLYKLQVGEKTYILRGFAAGGYNSVIFGENNFPFIADTIDWSQATLSYDDSRYPGASTHNLSVFESGKPYEGFTMAVTVQ